MSSGRKNRTKKKSTHNESPCVARMYNKSIILFLVILEVVSMLKGSAMGSKSQLSIFFNFSHVRHIFS